MGETARKTAQDVLRDFRIEQILEAAEQVIGEAGYEAASVDRIAQTAGVSRSTIYAYFPNKEEILLGCLTMRREQLIAGTRAYIDAGESTLEKLAGFIRGMLEAVDEGPRFFRAIASLDTMFPSSAGPGAQGLAEVAVDFSALFQTVLDQGAESSDVADSWSEHAQGVVGPLILGAMWLRAHEPKPIPAAERARELAALVLQGMCADRPPVGPTKIDP